MSEKKKFKTQKKKKSKLQFCGQTTIGYVKEPSFNKNKASISTKEKKMKNPFQRIPRVRWSRVKDSWSWLLRVFWAWESKSLITMTRIEDRPLAKASELSLMVGALLLDSEDCGLVLVGSGFCKVTNWEPSSFVESQWFYEAWEKSRQRLVLEQSVSHVGEREWMGKKWEEHFFKIWLVFQLKYLEG